MDLRTLLGMQPQANPLQSLLGQYYNPQALQQQTLSSALTGAGLGLLSMGPSPVKPSLGSYIGAAAKGGILGGMQGQEDYKKSALDAYSLDRQKTQDEQDLRDRQKAENDRMTQKKAVYDYADTLGNPKQSSFMKAFPEYGAKQMAQQIFPDPEGANGGGVFGNVYFDKQGRSWILGKDGNMRQPGGTGGAELMTPEERAQQTAAGKLQGEAPRYVVEKYVKEVRPAMQQTTEAMSAVQQAKALLQRGIQSGRGADAIQGLRGWGATLGIQVDERILSDTQAYQNFIGNIVIPKMQQLGGNDSNEEMRKMYSLSGGDITQAPEALALTLDYTEKLLAQRMQGYQAYEKAALPYLSQLPAVDTSPLSTQGGAQSPASPAAPNTTGASGKVITPNGKEIPWSVE
jgi:hypothetical protein